MNCDEQTHKTKSTTHNVYDILPQRKVEEGAGKRCLGFSGRGGGAWLTGQPTNHGPAVAYSLAGGYERQWVRLTAWWMVTGAVSHSKHRFPTPSSARLGYATEGALFIASQQWLEKGCRKPVLGVWGGV